MAKNNNEIFEYIIYCIFCVLTFGLLAVLRVTISEGIRKAEISHLLNFKNG